MCAGMRTASRCFTFFTSVVSREVIIIMGNGVRAQAEGGSRSESKHARALATCHRVDFECQFYSRGISVIAFGMFCRARLNYIYVVNETLLSEFGEGPCDLFLKRERFKQRSNPPLSVLVSTFGLYAAGRSPIQACLPL